MNRVEEMKSLKPFFSNLRNESDRACAILAGAFLDSRLEKLLRKAMIPTLSEDLFKGFGPLSSFSAKIDIAYSLGLISKDEQTDLHAIRKIRNEFAHELDNELSFDTSTVSNRAHTLRLPDWFESVNHLADKPLSNKKIQEIKAISRKRFEFTVGMLTSRLYELTKVVLQPTEPEGLTDQMQRILNSIDDIKKKQKEHPDLASFDPELAENIKQLIATIEGRNK